MLKRLLPLAALLLMPTAVLAGPASDAVRFFYAPDADETDAGNRDRFTGAALAKLGEYDASTKGGEEIGCIDWVMAIDAQDLDEAELARSLKLEEKVEGDKATVTARFKLFEDEQSRREIVWDLARVGGDWKIADIASLTTGWRLSQLECSPAAAE